MLSMSSSLSRDPLSSLCLPRSSKNHSKVDLATLNFSGCRSTLSKVEEVHLRIASSFGRNPTSRVEAYEEPLGLTQELSSTELEDQEKTGRSLDPFGPLKRRFLRFKREQFLEYQVHFKNLAEAQEPKFLVIACADSRVCPSAILGFQPGEAFTVRNIANLVPPFESGPSETKAALEFSVNTLQVRNILVIGHSRCGGIRALMSMQDEIESDGSFIKEWVVIGKNAKLHTKDVAEKLSFDHQCSHCEKESIKQSMLRLLTYPWIEEKVKNGFLSIHGGYYDFVDCTFEKWTLDSGGNSKDDSNLLSKDHCFWS
ncbi:beta carbonic anhydrase 5, chloroplastic-like [Aristolochia californica]|uniref:beta carbonic anhydrase 5, chloroplastic-like n=1 Tax=Aristolochia californica TaxID=171875 RepID=UPI0035D79BC0